LPNLIGSDQLTVSEYTVGSYAERTYEKTFVESYNYTFNHSYGISGSITFSAGIPLTVQTEYMVSGNAQWGASQSWTH
jgi:hypothetical protein